MSERKPKPVEQLLAEFFEDAPVIGEAIRNAFQAQYNRGYQDGWQQAVEDQYFSEKQL